MIHQIHFHISREYEQYVAEGQEAAIVTQAFTLDELIANIQEAVELHFDGEQNQLPEVLIEFSLAELIHG